MNVSFNTVLAALFVYAPQYYTVDPDILAGYQVLYNLVSCQINVQFLGCCAVSAFALLMAAYLSLQSNQYLGVNSNISEGDLSLGFNVNPDINFLNLSPYGRAYLDLVSRTTIGSTVTNLPIVLGGVINAFPVGCGCYGGGQLGGYPFAGA